MGSEILELSKSKVRNIAEWFGRKLVLLALCSEYDDVQQTLNQISIDAHGPYGHWQIQINYVKKTHPGINQLGEFLASIQKQKPYITHEQLANLSTLWSNVDKTIDKKNYTQIAIMCHIKLAILRLLIELLSEKH